MLLAIISDIHSNLEALTTALKIIEQHQVDEIICLGDIVGYGANPNECIELVRKHCNVVVKGNHDEAILNLDLTNRFNESAREAIYWTHKKITKKNFEYLESLPLTSKKQNIFFVHSSPYEPEEWHYIFGLYYAFDIFDYFSESICFIGHTHMPAIFSRSGKTREIKKDNRYVINVGSIGQPRDGNPQLSFGLFNTTKWLYENIRSPYNVKLAAEKIINNGLPPTLGHRLLIGT